MRSYIKKNWYAFLFLLCLYVGMAYVFHYCFFEHEMRVLTDNAHGITMIELHKK